MQQRKSNGFDQPMDKHMEEIEREEEQDKRFMRELLCVLTD